MQTQYQLLYRYINESTNTAITNEMDYEETKEFYTADHKLYYNTRKLREFAIPGSEAVQNGKTVTAQDADTVFGWNNGIRAVYRSGRNDKPTTEEWDKMDQLFDTTEDTSNPSLVFEYCSSLNTQAETERENIIISQMGNADKANNFYVYNGTSKEYHKKYVPQTVGYLVDNIDGIPKLQYPDGPGDWSKDFVMLGGSQPGRDGAYLVCKSEKIHSYKTDVTIDPTIKKEQLVMTGDKLASTCIFDFYDPTNLEYVPSYEETEAVITEITEDTVRDEYGGSRIVTIGGEDYLITSATYYYAKINSTRTEERVTINGSTGWRNVYYCSFGDLLSRNEEKYGTLFYKCGSILPNQIEICVVDGSIIYADEISSSFSHSTKIQDVSNALNSYLQNVNMKDPEGVRFVETYPIASTDKAPIAYPQTHTSNEGTWTKYNYFIAYTGWKLSDLASANMTNYKLRLSINIKNVTRTTIPEHYEQSSTAPYLVKDNYKKIPMSPWILHSVHNSLESVLTKAKKLVSMIGIDNVKVIKVVPFEQFVKIK